jgi:hypothetical protein
MNQQVSTALAPVGRLAADVSAPEPRATASGRPTDELWIAGDTDWLWPSWPEPVALGEGSLQ